MVDILLEEAGIYDVSGEGISVTFWRRGKQSGTPELVYQDTSSVKEFAGDQIKIQRTEAGELVSVHLLSVPVRPTIFSLLVPETARFLLQPSTRISCIGIRTWSHRDPLGAGFPPSFHVQCYRLEGNAIFD